MTKDRVFVAGLFLAAVLIAFSPATATASLIQLNDVNLTGQGIGAQLTVITLQSPGSSSVESGTVEFDGSTTGNVQTGSSQSTTFTLADLGLAASANPGSALAFIVNLTEPGSETPPMVTTAAPYGITLTVYDQTGTASTSFSSAIGLVLEQVAGGVGGSGILFGLDAMQAGDFNTFVFGNPGTEVMAVSASFANAVGGHDVIQATTLTGPAVVPEPATMMLLGTGLLGLVRFIRRRP